MYVHIYIYMYGIWWKFQKFYRKDFADYADFCFKTFGDRVKNRFLQVSILAFYLWNILICWLTYMSTICVKSLQGCSNSRGNKSLAVYHTFFTLLMPDASCYKTLCLGSWLYHISLNFLGLYIPKLFCFALVLLIFLLVV